MTTVIKIPLDNLGMSREQMLDLTNRLNKATGLNWVFEEGYNSYGQQYNQNIFSNQYQNQIANPLFMA
jgi:hypothetical protein